MSVKVHEAFSLDSAQDRYLYFDHFLGDQLKDEWNKVFWGVGAGVDVVDLQMGGIVRLTTGNATDDTTRIDWNAIRSLHVSKRVSMEIRAKTNQDTYILLLLVLQFDGDNRIAFSINEGVGGAINWWIYCTDGGFTTTRDSGVALDTNYHRFRIEAHLHGGSHAHFYIDGDQTDNSPIDTNVPDDPGDYLQPVFYILTHENVVKSMDIDYVVVRQDR